MKNRTTPPPRKSSFPSAKFGQRLGILGGGQLARMLALAAHPLGLEVHILSAHPNDPAAQVTPHWRPWPKPQKNSHNETIRAIRDFAKGLDFLTFESEFVDAQVVATALNDLHLEVYPSLECVGLFQDRARQKQTLNDFGIKTAPFILVQNKSDLEKAHLKFDGRFVLKQRKNGYDGNGTFYCKKPSDLRILQTLVEANSDGFIAEEWIPFRRECALMIVRSRQSSASRATGSFAELPLMESQQKDSRCDWVLGPITHPKLVRIKTQIKKMMNQLDYVGALGIEFFDTGKDLLVNELAPRVHNSGHFSQNGLSRDQFTLHVLAGLGKKMPTPQKANKALGMVNLIGTFHGTLMDLKYPEVESELHWYGKTENRPGRKLGHLNLSGANSQKVLKTLLQDRKKFKL